MSTRVTSEGTVFLKISSAQQLEEVKRERKKVNWQIVISTLLYFSKNVLSNKKNILKSIVENKICQLTFQIPVGSPSLGGDVTVYVWHKPTELAYSFLFCSCVYFSLYGPFYCVWFHKFSRHPSVLLPCSFGFVSALLALSTRLKAPTN